MKSGIKVTYIDNNLMNYIGYVSDKEHKSKFYIYINWVRPAKIENCIEYIPNLKEIK
jgi:hypothetical protein